MESGSADNQGGALPFKLTAYNAARLPRSAPPPTPTPTPPAPPSPPRLEPLCPLLVQAQAPD